MVKFEDYKNLLKIVEQNELMEPRVTVEIAEGRNWLFRFHGSGCLSILANGYETLLFFLLSKVGLGASELGPCCDIFSYFFFFDLIQNRVLPWSQFTRWPGISGLEIYIDDLVIQFLTYNIDIVIFVIKSTHLWSYKKAI